MFRQIVALITLAALLIFNIGCSHVITVSADEAVKKHQVSWKTGSPVQATRVELIDGKVHDVDSAGISYSKEQNTVQGRTTGGQAIDVPSMLVNRVTYVAKGCDEDTASVDLRSYLKFAMAEGDESPLKVRGHRVFEIGLKNGAMVKLDGSGLLYACDSTWVGRAPSGEAVTISQSNISSYTYRKFDVAQTIAVSLALLAVAAAITVAIVALTYHPGPFLQFR